MNLKNIPVVLLLPVFISGCYSYRIFPKQLRSFKTPAATTTVYVENPEFKKEFSILKNSGIYKVTHDSSCSVRIKLHKMKQRLACGTAFPAWGLFLGQIPMYMPDLNQYSFEEIKNGDTTIIDFRLGVEQRYWFWDIFSRKKNFNKEAGKALAANYYNPLPNNITKAGQ
jgi:hypothetical protein